MKTMLPFLLLVAALCTSSLACDGWSEAEMPPNLHCKTDYVHQIRCEYRRDTNASCVFNFRHKSKWLDIAFTGVMNGSTTRAVFRPTIDQDYLDDNLPVFLSFHTYNVEVDCEGVKHTGVFKPSCVIVTDAPSVSCTGGTCDFKAQPHEVFGSQQRGVTYKYRIRSVLGDWGPLQSIHGPTAGLTVDINRECDRLLSTLAVELTDIRMEIEVSAWYIAENGYSVVNTYAIANKYTWSP